MQGHVPTLYAINLKLIKLHSVSLLDKDDILLSVWTCNQEIIFTQLKHKIDLIFIWVKGARWKYGTRYVKTIWLLTHKTGQESREAGSISTRYSSTILTPGQTIRAGRNGWWIGSRSISAHWSHTIGTCWTRTISTGWLPLRTGTISADTGRLGSISTWVETRSTNTILLKLPLKYIHNVYLVTTVPLSQVQVGLFPSEHWRPPRCWAETARTRQVNIRTVFMMMSWDDCLYRTGSSQVI